MEVKLCHCFYWLRSFAKKRELRAYGSFFFFFFFLFPFSFFSLFLFHQNIHISIMAQQAKQAAQKLGGMFPQGSGKGIGGAAGALIVLGGLGYGINTALFNGKVIS
jgi:hypothetical protein